MKKILVLIAIVSCATGHAQTVDLISLGSGTFTLDGGSTIGLGTQTVTGLFWTPSVVTNDQLAGTFTTADWTPYTNPLNYTGFGVRMSVNGVNPNLAFSVELYDSLFNIVDTYDGSTFGLTATPSIVPLTLNLPGTGNYSSITGLLFTWNGSGTINTEVTEVVAIAVPEPSAYALLAMGAFAMGGYMLRRRQRG